MDNTRILRVSSSTNIQDLKTSIAGYIKGLGQIYVDGIGMEANYKALKSIVLARGQLAACGYDLSTTPYFKAFEIDTNPAPDDNIRNGFRWVLKLTNNF